jgi:hypothetical protein
MIAGVTPQVARVFSRSGLTALIGADNVISAAGELFGALNGAMTVAQKWIAGHSANPMTKRPGE